MGAPDGRSLRRFPARRPKALWIGPAHVALNRSCCLFFLVTVYLFEKLAEIRKWFEFEIF
jgi:hypothetical protein